MLKSSILQMPFPRKELALPGLRAVADARADFPPARKIRSRIWDLSAFLHCSIIGTCLTPGELRRLFHKLGHPEAATATDHVLHGNGVVIAGRSGVEGKLLQKTLDDKHAVALRRTAKLKTAEELRRFWDASLEVGEIPGAYWAVLTHPAATRELIRDVFGEVHMLSHLVGSANRMDIQRLRTLERSLADRNSQLARQQERLEAAARERTELARRLDAMAGELAAARACRPTPDAAAGTPGPDGARSERLAGRNDALELRLRTATGRIGQLEALLDAAGRRQGVLEHELASLEAHLDISARAAPAPGPPAGRSILYVGGRKGTVEQIRQAAAMRGVAMICHDGGVENSPNLLAGQVSRVEIVMFPTDCVSHAAIIHIKRACREQGKPYLPLRTGSIASFLAALDGGIDRETVFDAGRVAS